MESKSQLNWMEQCSFCFKSDKSNLKLFSLRYLCRHLKIRFKQLFFNCARKVEHLEHGMLEVKTDLDKAEVKLCSECGKLIEKLTDLLQCLEKVQMEVDWWLQGIRKLIIESDKNSKRDSDQLSILAETIKEVRRSIVKPIKPATLKPTLRLKRCDLGLGFAAVLGSREITSDPESESNYISSLDVKVEIDEEVLLDDDADNAFDTFEDDDQLNQSETNNFSKRIIDNGIRLTGSNRIKCKVCSRTFGEKAFFKHFNAVHLRKTKPYKDLSRIFKCGIGDCDYIAKENSKLTNHQSTCQGMKKTPKVVNFTCEICGDGFETKNNLNAHKRRVHSTKVLKCDECGREFKTLNYLTEHVERIHLKIRHKCNHIGCEKSYATKQLLRVHKRVCEKPHPPPPPPRSQLEESSSLTIEEPQQPQYSMDQAMENCIELDKKKYQCKLCNKISKEKFTFRTHFKLRHVRERPFECDLCPKKFIESHQLKIHKQNVHAFGEFKCLKGECRYTTKSEAYLKSHQKICDGSKKTAYLIGGDHMCSTCGKRFSSKGNLWFHQRYTHNGRKFVCDHCGKGFKRKDHLQVHVRGEHLGIRYECDYSGCGRQFRNTTVLNNHKKICPHKPCDNATE